MKPEGGHPDAEDAKVPQRTQKDSGFFLRPLRNLCVLCVRLSGFITLRE